jgi:hypothetical protein
MRQLFLTATILLLGSLAGCAGPNCGSCGGGSCGSGGCAGGGSGAGWCKGHGICDCEMEDYCSSRSPWIRNGYSAAPPVEVIQPPAKLPDGKKNLE